MLWALLLVLDAINFLVVSLFTMVLARVNIFSLHLKLHRSRTSMSGYEEDNKFTIILIDLDSIK